MDLLPSHYLCLSRQGLGIEKQQREKKERKQKTVQKTYFVGISLQRSHVTILAETWHSAGISEPNGALCNADCLEGVVYYIS